MRTTRARSFTFIYPRLSFSPLGELCADKFSLPALRALSATTVYPIQAPLSVTQNASALTWMWFLRSFAGVSITYASLMHPRDDIYTGLGRYDRERRPPKRALQDPPTVVYPIHPAGNRDCRPHTIRLHSRLFYASTARPVRGPGCVHQQSGGTVASLDGSVCGWRCGIVVHERVRVEPFVR